MKIIDYRSDTVTKPTPQMREAMMNAEVGDDVYKDDPTVNELESLAASMTGMEDAIFAPSGTQTNLIGLLCHCQRGEEYIVGNSAHTYMYEAGGAATLGSIQPNVVPFEADKTLDLTKVASVIKPNDFHFAQAKVLCLENTNFGHALPMEYLKEAYEFAHSKGLKLHMDGARAFNAAVEHGVSIKEIAKQCDSISLCLSKGLGAPVGSLLCGTNEFITQAKRWRKMLGGGMRQSGILAAAGIYALQNNIKRLSIDHDNAKYLATELSKIEGINIVDGQAFTNILQFTLKGGIEEDLSKFLSEHSIIISAYKNGPIRLVTHLGIDRKDIDHTIELIKQFISTSN